LDTSLGYTQTYKDIMNVAQNLGRVFTSPATQVSNFLGSSSAKPSMALARPDQLTRGHGNATPLIWLRKCGANSSRSAAMRDFEAGRLIEMLGHSKSALQWLQKQDGVSGRPGRSHGCPSTRPPALNRRSVRFFAGKYDNITSLCRVWCSKGRQRGRQTHRQRWGSCLGDRACSAQESLRNTFDRPKPVHRRLVHIMFPTKLLKQTTSSSFGAFIANFHPQLWLRAMEQRLSRPHLIAIKSDNRNRHSRL